MFRTRLTLLLLLCVAAVAQAENWPSWRGPTQDCVAGGRGFPRSWSETENVRWKIKLPGWGTSTPAVWESRIFVSTVQDEKNALLALDRDGQQLWSAPFGAAAGNRNRKASASNPSPVCDAERVVCYFKSGDLACLSHDGKTIWQLNLQEKYGPDRLLWDLGTSPVLTADLVVVAVMHAGPSYVVALDKKTGSEVWKRDRDLGAPGEARDSYTTPLVLQQGGREIVVVLGADHVTAYAAATGEEVWRAGGLNPDRQFNFRSIASPAAAENLIIAPYARGRSLTAIRRDGQGDVSDSHVAWTQYGSYPDVPTPIVHEGRVYVCGDRGDVTCLELASGKEIWTHALPRNRYPYSSSPILAEGHLYLTREDGTTFVLQLGDTPAVVAENVLRENTYATPVFVDGRIYLRTSDYLFCLGTPARP